MIHTNHRFSFIYIKKKIIEVSWKPSQYATENKEYKN